MIQSPILKVLSVMHGFQVRFLLMGGQACIVYGGSEFSRDTDLVIMPDTENLDKLRAALRELRAETIAVPDLSLAFLLKGHAVHFRCKYPEAFDMRIDIMSVLRNAPPFDSLWQRRTSIELSDKLTVEVVSLPDLVAIKKTQRDKDWSHIRRLVEAHYFERREEASAEDIRFWLLESRTPDILRELAKSNPASVQQLQDQRPLLTLLPESPQEAFETALIEEESRCRALDRAYWQPLLAELEKIRHDQA